MFSQRALPTFACTCVLSWLFAGAAHAAPIAGRTELQLQTQIVNFTHVTLHVPGDASGSDTSTSGTQFGLTPRFGVGIGHGLSEHALFHLLAAFGTSHTSSGPSQSSTSVSQTDVEFLPSVRYVADGDRARLYLGGGVGIASSRTTVESTTTSTRSFELAGVMGVHAFLNDYVSLDPGLEVTWQHTSADSGPEGSGDSTKASGRGVSVMVTLGLSGWLGHSRDLRSSESAQSPEFEVARAEPVRSPTTSAAAQLNLPGFGIYLNGVPEKRGDVVQVRASRLFASAPEWESCALELRDGTNVITVPTRHSVRTTERGLREEQLSGLISFAALEGWDLQSAKVAVCNDEYPLNSQSNLQIKLFLRQFTGIAERFGTYQAPAAQQTPMPAFEAPAAAPAEPAAAPDNPAPETASDAAQPAEPATSP